MQDNASFLASTKVAHDYLVSMTFQSVFAETIADIDQHRRNKGKLAEEGAGLAIFRNGVDAAAASLI